MAMPSTSDRINSHWVRFSSTAVSLARDSS
jgi:hypothetical protein